MVSTLSYYLIMLYAYDESLATIGSKTWKSLCMAGKLLLIYGFWSNSVDGVSLLSKSLTIWDCGFELSSLSTRVLLICIMIGKVWLYDTILNVFIYIMWSYFIYFLFRGNSERRDSVTKEILLQRRYRNTTL